MFFKKKQESSNLDTSVIGSRKNVSIGFKLGIFIALILIVILGSKTVYDSTKGYKSSIQYNEKIVTEQTRKLSKDVEIMFNSMYQSAKGLEIIVSQM